MINYNTVEEFAIAHKPGEVIKSPSVGGASRFLAERSKR